ncbi:unnamed protein product, partial [Oncorhynchus mykiss]
MFYLGLDLRLGSQDLLVTREIVTWFCPVPTDSQGCTAYDVVISEAFFQKCQKDPLFQQFLIAVSLEGLENKYNLELSRDWKVLKNRKFLGSVNEQNIRTKSKPVIQEIEPKYVFACSFFLSLSFFVLSHTTQLTSVIINSPLEDGAKLTTVCISISPLSLSLSLFFSSFFLSFFPFP